MDARRLSAEELAGASRIDQQTVEAIREARREPTAEDLVRLAGVLNVPVGELLAGVAWVPDGKGGGEYHAADPEAD